MGRKATLSSKWSLSMSYKQRENKENIYLEFYYNLYVLIIINLVLATIVAELPWGSRQPTGSQSTLVAHGVPPHFQRPRLIFSSPRASFFWQLQSTQKFLPILLQWFLSRQFLVTIAPEVFWLPKCFSHSHRTSYHSWVLCHGSFPSCHGSLCCGQQGRGALCYGCLSAHYEQNIKQVYVLKNIYFSLSLKHFKDRGHTVLTSESMLLLKQNVNNY